MPGKPENRKRPPVTLTLSPEALSHLDAIAERRGLSRSATVELLVRSTKLPPKPPKPKGKRT
jgi:ribbon-helix-helix CopG family protein